MHSRRGFLFSFLRDPVNMGEYGPFRCQVDTVRIAFSNPDICTGEVRLMMTRMAKLLLLAGVAVFYTLVIFNNLTDFDSNYQFVRHVLSMDTTFPGNNGMWRAMPWAGWHLAFYVGIIAWEIATTILLWWGVARLVAAFRSTAVVFNGAKRLAVLAMTVSSLMWLVAFLSVGGEWFLMWQSPHWNGQDAAFRNFAVVGLVLLIMLQPDCEGQA